MPPKQRRPGQHLPECSAALGVRHSVPRLRQPPMQALPPEEPPAAPPVLLVELLPVLLPPVPHAPIAQPQSPMPDGIKL